jgi:large subunit ribosomal protein L21
MTMFAILETGGKQYKIAEGDILEVELLPEELVKKNSISLTTVLLLQGDKDLLIGDPYVKNARVKAKVLEEIKADKIHIYKMKSKKGYRKSQGHRQKLHKIQIEKIEIKAPAKTKETE